MNADDIVDNHNAGLTLQSQARHGGYQSKIIVVKENRVYDVQDPNYLGEHRAYLRNAEIKALKK